MNLWFWRKQPASDDTEFHKFVERRAYYLSEKAGIPRAAKKNFGSERREKLMKRVSMKKKLSSIKSLHHKIQKRRSGS